MRLDMNYNIKRNKGKHLTFQDRLIIEHLYNVQNKNFTEIAMELNCHRTTISREIKKGLVKLRNYNWSYRLEYNPYKAQKVYDINATAKGTNLKIGKNRELAEFIEEKIDNKYSPEAISQHIKENKKFSGISLHWKTIYNYIDKGILNKTRENLIHGKYRKEKNKPKESQRTKEYKKGRTIRDRPETANKREEIGHWEMDLVEGKKGQKEPYLLVLTERKTRKEIIELIPNKSSKSVIKAIDKLERNIGVVKFREIFKSITTDNGTEFKDYRGLERSYTGSRISRTKIYYCDAYSSWQRGTNENINKMIRRFLPKGSSFKKLRKQLVKEIEEYINTYPRKILNYKTSKEEFEKGINYVVKKL